MSEYFIKFQDNVKIQGFAKFQDVPTENVVLDEQSFPILQEDGENILLDEQETQI